MRYPVVLLDVGETLIGPRESFGAVYARVLAPLGLDFPARTFETALRGAWREFDRTIPRGADRYRFFPGGEHGYWLQFVRDTLDRLPGVPAPAGFAEKALEPLREAFLGDGAWHVYPDVVPALEELRDAGARLGVVSNWDSRLPEILGSLDLLSYFETLAISHFEGAEKPDPLLFRVALERMHAAPGEAIHVGDRPDLDLEGARAAGMDGVIVDRDGTLDGSLPLIRDMARLPAIAREGL